MMDDRLKVCYRKLLRHFWWLLPVLLLASFLTFNYLRAKQLEMRLVKVVPFSNAQVLATEPYIIVRDGMTAVACFDWDGNERWRVQGATVDLSVAYNSESFFENHDIKVSPDGRTLAMVVRESEKNWRVQTWHDGKKTCDLRFPHSDSAYNALVYPQNSGIVYLATGISPILPDNLQLLYKVMSTILALKDGQVIAKGKISSYSIISHNGAFCLVPIPNKWRYSVVSIIDNKIVLRNKYTANIPKDCKWYMDVYPLIDGNAYLRGNVYRPDGTSISSSTDWRTPPLFQYFGNGVLEYKEDVSRLYWRWYQASTEVRWPLPTNPPGGLDKISVTADGCFLVQQICNEDSLPAWLREKIQSMTHITFPSSYFTHRVCLYSAPDQLRAVISYHGRIDGQYGDNEYYHKDGYQLPDGRRVQLRDIHPSPDGHSLVAVEYNRQYPATGYAEDCNLDELESIYPYKPNGSLLFFHRR